MKGVERRGSGRGRGSREADDRLGGGLAGPVALRTGRTAARSGAAAPGRPAGSRSGATCTCCPTGAGRPTVRRCGRLARDNGSGVGAAAVGVLNRRDSSSCRRSGCCKGQKADRSGDLRPHAAELSSWSYRRRLARPSSGRKLRRVPAASDGAVRRRSLSDLPTPAARRSAAVRPQAARRRRRRPDASRAEDRYAIAAAVPRVPCAARPARAASSSGDDGRRSPLQRRHEPPRA